MSSLQYAAHELQPFWAPRYDHDLGDGEPCQAHGCIRRDTVWSEVRDVWLCEFHTGALT